MDKAEVVNDEFLAIVSFKLGNTHVCLSEIKDKEANLRLAIKAYKDALIFYTLEKSPENYATIQHCLGRAYGELALMG